MKVYTDYLIIGSGIAGLTYALKVANSGKVLMVTKATESESNTKYAQGGIAAVWVESDSYEKHINDTLIAGDGLCDPEVVRMVVTESTDRVKELIEWGTNFDKTPTGEYDLAKEGGHSDHRILHHKDITGYEIERALLESVHNHPNITILDHHFAVDIITQHHLGQEVNSQTPDINCFGCYVLDTETGNVLTILSKITLLATGGCGSVYATTTNPAIATGDGIAMAYRAKARVEGMEFIQFHPTSLYNPRENPSFLVSEAVRGAGGVLKTIDGQEFMHKYDERLSLAPRDIVARAIDNELKLRGDDYVYLDCKGIEIAHFKSHFPNIYDKCLSLGIDVTKDMIPVVPAAHYVCGGVKVDMHGRTHIKNLYAAGECASTGLHGANRLASNSLLEAVVYAHRAAVVALESLPTLNHNTEIPDWDAHGTAAPEEMILLVQTKRELQSIMNNYVGIVRSNLRLKRAYDRLEILWEENEKLYQKTTLSPKLCELRNLITVAYLIIKQAQQRKESRGLHYSITYKNKYAEQ